MNTGFIQRREQAPQVRGRVVGPQAPVGALWIVVIPATYQEQLTILAVPYTNSLLSRLRIQYAYRCNRTPARARAVRVEIITLLPAQIEAAKGEQLDIG